MQTVSGNTTIAAYCQEMERRETIVNRDYQRSDKVWPPAAQSYLIETVLLGYPIPKLSLFQRTDVRSRRVVREIVDGQQRSRAFLAFYQNDFALAKSIETLHWRGLSYSELEEDEQRRFLDYSLSIDVFTSATSEEVREVFRRMNSYTIPLNDEEQRHAKWQGLYKWFIHDLTRQYDAAFLRIGLFSEKSLVRMQDAKLLTEVCRAFLHGIETTKKAQLDAVYRDLDTTFVQEGEFGHRLRTSLDQALAWEEIHRTSLMKPHIVYSLLLAISHVRDPIPALSPLFHSTNHALADPAVVLPRLTSLADALDLGAEEQESLPPKERRFIAASAGRTNVKEQREVRFKWFCEALSAPVT